MTRISLAVVIPTLNAAEALPRCLGALEEALTEFALRVVVVDGGSKDGTAELARGLDADLVMAPAGRGGQLAAGAKEANSDWLLFLHADTVLAPGWSAEVARFISQPANSSQAAAFRHALDDDARAARRQEAIVAWRCRVFGLPYGDQGLLIARSFYDEIGGFRPLPVMEDVDILRRIGPARIVMLETAAVTSAARYRREGYGARSARNLACLGLYALGVPLRIIAWLYGRSACG